MSILAKCPQCDRRWRLERTEDVTLIPCGEWGQGLIERSWREIRACECGQLYQIADDPVLERDAWCLTRSRALGAL